MLHRRIGVGLTEAEFEWCVKMLEISGCCNIETGDKGAVIQSSSHRRQKCKGWLVEKRQSAEAAEVHKRKRGEPLLFGCDCQGQTEVDQHKEAGVHDSVQDRPSPFIGDKR